MTRLAADVWSHWSLGQAVGSPREMAQELSEAGYQAAILADFENLNGAWEWMAACEAVGLTGLIGVSVPVAGERGVILVRAVARTAGAWPRLCQLAVPGPPRDWDALDSPDLLLLIGPGGGAGPRLSALCWRLTADPREPGPLAVPELAAVPARFPREADREAWETLRQIGGVSSGYAANGGPVVPAALVEQRFAGQPGALGAWDEVLAAAAANSLPHVVVSVPHFAAVGEADGHAQLADQAHAGLAARLGGDPPAAYRERLAHELSTIAHLKFASYFLVVADLVAAARARDIAVGPGRGSAAASLVAYGLGITDVDPLQYDLVFERFLNPYRASPPDIDLDIEDTRRRELIRYLQDRYGHERVAQIGTYATLGPRAALREVGRVRHVPAAEVERALRAAVARSDPRGEGTDPAPNAAWGRIAERLEGTPHHASVHAAGVVIAPDALAHWTPVIRTDGQAVTGLDMHGIQALGLIKFDLLGLRTLTVLKHARQLAPSLPPLAEVPPADPAALALLSAGDTEGVFQLDGRGVRDLLRQLRPESIKDIMLTVALYRPGPMDQIGEYLRRRRSGFRPTTALEALLADTLGVLVYQEQLMAVAREFAGYDWARADLFRQAVSKKDRTLLDAERRRFVQGATQRTGRADLAEELWEQVVPFAQYGFNRAHAAAYGLVAYYAAYVKAHAPAAFWAGELATRSGDDLVRVMAQAMREGVAVRAPHVNGSAAAPRLTDDGQAVQLGLTAIRGVSWELAHELVRRRPPGLGYQEVAAVRRVLGSRVPEGVLAQMARAGALAGLRGVDGDTVQAEQLDLWQLGVDPPRSPPSRPAPDRDGPWPTWDGRVYIQVTEWSQRLERRLAAHAERWPGSREMVVVEGDRRRGRRVPGARVSGGWAARRALLADADVVSVVVGVRAGDPVRESGRDR